MTGGTQHSVRPDAFASHRSGTRFGSHRGCHFLNTAEGVENQLHTARYAQFVEDPKQVVPYGVFGQVEIEGSLLVPQIFRAVRLISIRGQA